MIKVPLLVITRTKDNELINYNDELTIKLDYNSESKPYKFVSSKVSLLSETYAKENKKQPNAPVYENKRISRKV